MIDRGNTSDAARANRIEAYLDGLLDDGERAAMESELRRDPALRREVELQAMIDDSLVRLFSVDAPTVEQISAALAPAGRTRNLPAPAPSASDEKAESRWGRWYWTAAGFAVAAGIAWVIAGALWPGSRVSEPLFASRPLADIYRDAVASGFEPSYECSDPARFADAFADRQGTPLELRAMPTGMRMLGLAYTGGLSRTTTAMLCVVDGKPVIVFVDRADADQSLASSAIGKSLHVFRQERDGLLFYEVTPFDRPRVTRYLSRLPDGGA